MGGLTISREVLARLLSEDQGQDLLEYALLAATVGVGAVAGLNFLLSMMGSSYSLTQTNVAGQWQTPDPGGI